MNKDWLLKKKKKKKKTKCKKRIYDKRLSKWIEINEILFEYKPYLKTFIYEV